MPTASFIVPSFLPSSRRHARIGVISIEDESVNGIDAEEYGGKSVVLPSCPQESVCIRTAAVLGSPVYQDMEPVEVSPAGVLDPLQQQSEYRLRGRDHDEMVQFAKQMQEGVPVVLGEGVSAEGEQLGRGRVRLGDQGDLETFEQRSLEEVLVLPG